MSRPARDESRRFWSKVDMSGPCWTWTASLNAGGYGQFAVGSRREGTKTTARAHIYAYEALVGPVPAGLVLDHLCRNRACVNPAHLEPVTLTENILRGDAPTAQNARKMACKYGHPFVRMNSGRRRCQVCQQAIERRRVRPNRGRPGRAVQP